MDMHEVTWDFELGNCDAQGTYSWFLEIVIPLVNKHVPLCEISSDTAHLPWQTNAPSALHISRKLSWDQYKQLGGKSPEAKEALATFLAINKN